MQVKMYGQASRPINPAIVMLTYGAAAYAECDRSMVATDGRVLDEARKVAVKLAVEIRHVPAFAGPLADMQSGDSTIGAVTFGHIWEGDVRALVGKTRLSAGAVDGRTRYSPSMAAGSRDGPPTARSSEHQHRDVSVDYRSSSCWTDGSSGGHSRQLHW